MSWVPGFELEARIEGTERGRVLTYDHAQLVRYVNLMRPDTYQLRVRKQRTKSQNAYLHAGPLPILMREWGYDTMEELKWDLMGMCWGWKRLRTGREVPIVPHTSDMSVEQCKFFIDWLIPFAAKQGVLLPLPDETAAA